MTTRTEIQEFILDECRSAFYCENPENYLNEPIEELGCDSIDKIELVMSVENEFLDEVGECIDDDEAAELKTINDFVEIVAKKLKIQ